MKVPYLEKIAKREYELYLAEFKASTAQQIATANNTPVAREMFTELFPLFVLLRGLVDSTHSRNIARDAILLELREASRKEDFLNLLVNHDRKHPFSAELARGLHKQAFTAYFNELFSDILLLLNSFCTNNYRGSLIALRCMLEDLYRHLFYRDHPQEYWAVHESGDATEMSLGISPKRLREFLPTTEHLKVFRSLSTDFSTLKDNEQTIFGLNEWLYDECSRAVHGSSRKSLSAFRSNADLTLDLVRAAEVLSIAKKFSGMAIAILVAAHMDHFLALNEYERSIILSSYSKPRRAAFRYALNI